MAKITDSRRAEIDHALAEMIVKLGEIRTDLTDTNDKSVGFGGDLYEAINVVKQAQHRICDARELIERKVPYCPDEIETFVFAS